MGVYNHKILLNRMLVSTRMKKTAHNITRTLLNTTYLYAYYTNSVHGLNILFYRFLINNPNKSQFKVYYMRNLDKPYICTHV